MCFTFLSIFHHCLGHYLYIYAASQKANEKAWIMTHSYPATSGHCLEFYYHMRGQHIGNFNIFLKVTS